MWVKEYTAECAASPAQVFSILAEPARWSEWNAGVRRIDMHGPFAEGTTAVMVLPDETALPFRFTWIEVDRATRTRPRCRMRAWWCGSGTNSRQQRTGHASRTGARSTGPRTLLLRSVPQ